jgi:tripartite-type tricarboxylate transporter receptor subunit TctC
MFAAPEFQKNFLDRQFFESIVGTPDELADYIRTEEPKWRKVIHEAGVKVD